MCALVLGLLSGCSDPEPAPLPSPGPQPGVIFDTDIGNDIDDALALAMLHTYANAGSIDLLAVTISAERTNSAPFVDLVNHFYGRGDTAIGVVRGGVPGAPDSYVDVVSLAEDGTEFLYPRDLDSSNDAPDAVTVLRRTLAGRRDSSVVIVSVGFATNLTELLGSLPDEWSPLSGVELIAAKVRFLSLMAGDFADTDNAEYNVRNDIGAAQEVSENWPTRIVWSGFEVGSAVWYPGESIESDFGYVAHHPIADSYEAYAEMPYDRPTWDMTSVLVAAGDTEPFLGSSAMGRVRIDDAGHSHFESDPSGLHQRLTVRPQYIELLRAHFVELVAAPPL